MSKTGTAADDVNLMSLPECAAYLHLSEKTVLQLAADNELPGKMVSRKWRFDRAAIDLWLQDQLSLEGEGIADIEDIPDGTRVPLGDVLPEEAVLGDLKATDALGVIEELAAHAYNHKWLIDKPWFVGAVVEREALASTAMDGGVAFLHTRSREADRLSRPFVIAGRSYEGIDFGAPDGKPTFLFFLLGLKYDKLHLPILGRLARTMLNPKTISRLRAQPSVAKMRALLLGEDAKALKQNKQVAVRYEALKPKLDKQMRLRTIMRLNAMRKHEARKAAEAERKAEVKAAKKRTKAEDGTAAAAKKKAAAAAKHTAAAKKPAAAKPAAVKPAAAKPAAVKPAAAKKKTAARSAAAAKKTAAKKVATPAKKRASKKKAASE